MRSRTSRPPLGEREALLEEAARRLQHVDARGRPLPLTPDLERAMLSLFAQDRALSWKDGRAPYASERRTALALLRHPDLSEEGLCRILRREWMLHDPAVLEQVLSHPSCTEKVVVLACRYPYRIRDMSVLDERFSPARRFSLEALGTAWSGSRRSLERFWDELSELPTAQTELFFRLLCDVERLPGDSRERLGLLRTFLRAARRI